MVSLKARQSLGYQAVLKVIEALVTKRAVTVETMAKAYILSLPKEQG